MCFKKQSLSIAMLFVLGFNLGCAKEDEPYHEIATIELKGARCLSESVTKIGEFFDGKANPSDVDAIWSCFSYALKTFDRYVRGSNQDVYSSRELRNFLETYFLKNEVHKMRRTHIISDALLDEMMNIKRLFLGGSKYSLEKDELLKTLDLIRDFHRITRDLLPYSQLLFINDPSSRPSEADYRAAEKVLTKAIADLVSLLNFNTSRYEMSNLSRLLSEIHLLFIELDPDTQFGKIHLYVPALARLKTIFLNSNSFAVESDEWPAVGEFLAKVATIGLRVPHTLDVGSLYSVDKFILLDQTLQKSIQLVEGSLNARGRRSIDSEELYGLIDELEKIDALPFKMSAVDSKKLIHTFLNFVLNPQGRYPTDGLTAEKLEYLKEELSGWSQVQFLMLRKEDPAENPYWQQMKNILKTPFSLSLDSLDRVILDGSTSETNIEGASRLNWARAGLSLLFKAYIGDPSRRTAKMNLSQKELHQAFLDLRPIFVGLDLIDADDFIYDQSLFRDANLFMPRSDGDDYLSLQETIEYLHFVFAGISAGSILTDEVDDKCRVSDKTLDVNCFRNNLKTRSAQYLAHLPLYVKYSSPLSDNQWRKDIKNMEKTNRKEGSSPDPILVSDIYETFVMLQYIEVIMLRFDEDGSGDLSIKEALKAFKHFKNVIGGLLGLDAQTDSDEIEALFTYMLKYGETPNFADPLSRMRFQNWKWQRKKWHLSADRGTLLQILATLKGL